MKMESRYLVMLIAALALCLVAWAKPNLNRGAWEYKILVVHNPAGEQYFNDEKLLNEYGAEGWELVTKDGPAFYILKRAK